MTLKECLERCLVVELRAMARQHALRLQSLLKGDIVSQLERHLLAWAEEHGGQRDLPDGARAALAALLDAGGVLPLAEMEARFGSFRRPLQGAIESAQPWGDGLSTSLDQLHVWGLLFRTDPPPPRPSEPSPGGVPAADAPPSEPLARIPRDVVERLRPLTVARPRPFRSAPPPPVELPRCPFLVQDAMLLASALSAAPAARLVGGGVSRRDLLRLNAHLLAPDEIADSRTEKSARRFVFLRSLALHLGLLELRADRFHPGPGLPSWLEEPAPTRWAALVRGYLALHPLEFEDLPGLQFNPLPAQDRIQAARRFMLELLREAEPGEWHSTASLVQTARTRNSFLLRHPDHPVSVRCAESGRPLTPRDWTSVEGAWIETVLQGPLYWLGLVDLGRSRKGEVTAFRVHAGSMGDLETLLGHSAGAPPASSTTPLSPAEDNRDPDNTSREAFDPLRSIRVRDDLTVEIGHGADLAAWHRLERCCELLERAPLSRYRISRERVRQLLQAGTKPEEILADAGDDVPAAAANVIASWANRFGQVRLFHSTVLTAGEAALMSELRAIPELAACLGAPLGSRSSVVQAGCEEAALAHLRAHGQMPHVGPYLEQRMREQQAQEQPWLDRDAWRQIHHALVLWRDASRLSGEAGPAECLLHMASRLAAQETADTVAIETGGPSHDPAAADLALVEEAIRRRRTLTFDYHDPAGVALVKLSPHGMSQRGGVTYLTGYRRGVPRQERFRLDWIRNVRFVN